MGTRLSSPQVLKSLMVCSFDEEDSPDIEQVLTAAARIPETFETVIRKIYYRIMDRQFKRPRLRVVSAAAQYFSSLRGRIDTEEFRYFDASLTLTACALDAGLLSASQGNRHRARTIINVVATLSEETFGEGPDSPESLALNVLLGQIKSIFDREAAAHHFIRVRNSEYRHLVPLFYWDSGAITYYSQDEVNTPESNVNRLSAGIFPLAIKAALTRSETVIAISVDEHFFRIYAGWFMHYAQQLPELNFAIYICAARPIVEDLVGDAEAYVSAMANLNRGKQPTNVTFYSVDVPAFVADERTFFACARFFALPQLLAAYQNVYLVDADLHFESDPSAFLAAVRNYGFAVSSNEGLISMPPWRRNMAGNIVANRAILETSFLDELLIYLAHGLAEPRNWMLDQNALTYAVERASPKSVRSLNGLDRPTIASKFMVRWERNYFSAKNTR